MNLFGVGPAEVVVILVIALIVVGPERLPRLAADIARTIRELRKYTGAIAAEFNDVIQDFERETEAERGDWKQIGQGLTEASRSVTDALRGAGADTAAALAEPPPASANGAGGPAAEWHEIPDPTAPSVSQTNGAAPAPEPAQEPR